MRTALYTTIVLILAVAYTACKKKESTPLPNNEKLNTVYTVPEDYSLNKQNHDVFFYYNLGAYGIDTGTSPINGVPVYLTRINDKMQLLQMKLNEVAVNDTLVIDSMIIWPISISNSTTMIEYKTFAHYSKDNWSGRLEISHLNSNSTFSGGSSASSYIYNLEYNIKRINDDEYLFARIPIPIE